jgi:hypothetical protein
MNFAISLKVIYRQLILLDDILEEMLVLLLKLNAVVASLRSNKSLERETSLHLWQRLFFSSSHFSGFVHQQNIKKNFYHSGNPFRSMVFSGFWHS